MSAPASSGRMNNSPYTLERKALAALLKDIRVSAGLTQIELAERSGWAQTDISKFERAARQLDFFQLRDLLKVMGTDIASVDMELTQRLQREAK